MLKFALYSSNHGFGHAARVSALAKELGDFGVFCHIRTDRPEFIFRGLDPHLHQISYCGIDFGVKHKENLVPDLDATKTELLQLMDKRPELVETEIAFLRENQIDLVVSDIPFLVVEACLYAEVPVIAISNFDWYYIYSQLFEHDLSMKPVVNCIYGLYKLVNHAFVLPFSSTESMSAFSSAENVGLLARKKDSYNDIREKYDIPPDTMILLSMFGGEGTPSFEISKLCKAFAGVVISSDHYVDASNHLHVDRDEDFLDLIKGADIILTKPGYSSFAEAVQYGKRILFFERANYPEERVLVDGLSKYQQKLRLPAINLDVRAWKEAISTLLMLPDNKRMANQNTRVASKVLAKYFEIKHSKPLMAVIDVGTNNLNYILHDETRVVHSSFFTTGLGAGFNNGLLAIKSLQRTKKVLARVLSFTTALTPNIAIIGTSVSREAQNINLLADWLDSKYNLEYRILTEADEIRLNRLAVDATFPELKNYLAFDIGGGSTEFVLSSGKSFSIPIGLLRLKNIYALFEERCLAISNALKDKDLLATQGTFAIGIGLTVKFLAMILRKRTHWSDDLNKIKIRLDELISLRDKLLAKRMDGLEAYLQEPYNLEILLLSTEFIIQILDKIGVSEFLVCEDGVSLGYIYDKKKNKNKRRSNR